MHMASRWESIVVDCQDSARLARWWGEVLGYKIIAEQDDYVAIGDGDNHPSLVFLPTTEHKTGKNRLHIDLTPDDQAAEVERLIDMGARHIDIGQGEQPWVVLADPEGNEFCVLAARG
jgi:catechol-2,3-dioxygenase